MKKHLIYILTGIIMILLIILFMLKNDLTIVRIDGNSMHPTLHDGNYVITTNYRKLEQGDIIMFHHGEQQFIKRVVGLPGDEIKMTQDCKLYINEELIPEDYIDCESHRFKSEQHYPFTVPENEYFVLGDNRNDSLDSRIISIGTIHDDEVIGKVVLVIYPFKTLK